jgi:hypothetical protein
MQHFGIFQSHRFNLTAGYPVDHDGDVNEVGGVLLGIATTSQVFGTHSGRGYIVRVGDAQIQAERDTDDVSNLCSFRKASAARSPMMMQGAMVLPVATRGMIEPSAMRRFSIP